ncbi:MAG: AI-2E family transporter [Acidimicrobiales bacterium]
MADLPSQAGDRPGDVRDPAGGMGAPTAETNGASAGAVPNGAAAGDATGAGQGSEPVQPGARRDQLFAAAEAKGVPLRTILTIDAVVVATYVLYRLVGRLREILLWLLIASFISLILNPAVVWLEHHRLRRAAAVSVVFLLAVLAFAGIAGLFGYPLVNALTHLAERIPEMTRQLKKGHGGLARALQSVHLLSWVQHNAPKLAQYAHSLSKPALSLGTNLGRAVFSTIVALLTITFLTLFILLEAPRIRAGVLGTMRPDRRQVVEETARTVSRSVSAYVLGTFGLSLLFGVVVYLTLLVTGVPFALLIGLWVALVAMIPLIGGLIAGVPSVVIALLHSPTAAVVVAIVFVVFQLTENHFLYPLVMSRTVRMNPLWVLLAVLIGANLGGVFGSSLGALTGALVGIPVGGACQVVFGEVWRRSRPGGEPVRGEERPVSSPP